MLKHTLFHLSNVSSSLCTKVYNLQKLQENTTNCKNQFYLFSEQDITLFLFILLYLKRLFYFNILRMTNLIKLLHI